MRRLHLQETLGAYSFRATLGSIQTRIMQEADWAFFEVRSRLLFARETGSELGLENEAAKLSLIYITMRVQTLGTSITLVNHMTSASNLIPHGIKSTLITCMLHQLVFSMHENFNSLTERFQTCFSHALLLHHQCPTTTHLLLNQFIPSLAALALPAVATKHTHTHKCVMGLGLCSQSRQSQNYEEGDEGGGREEEAVSTARYGIHQREVRGGTVSNSSREQEEIGRAHV